MPPTVSIVIPHYGDPGPTQRLVTQLLAQESAQVEQIIVSDDASPAPFPKGAGIEVVRRARNGGFGSAVNTGVDAARGELLLILNSDLDVPHRFVEEMLEATTKHPRSVLSPRIVGEDGSFGWPGRNFPRIHHQATEWLTPLARWRETGTWHRAVGHDLRARTADSRVDWVVGAAMLIPADAFHAVGGFDERFYMNAEEVDLQRRLQAMGIDAIALATPVVIHSGGGSSPSAHRREWLVEGRLLYARKWGGERRLRSALTGCSLLNFVVNCLRRAKGSPVAPIATLRTELGLALGPIRQRDR